MERIERQFWLEIQAIFPNADFPFKSGAGGSICFSVGSIPSVTSIERVSLPALLFFSSKFGHLPFIGE